MFEGLKKKFSSFIDSISKKEAEAIKEESRPEPATEVQKPVETPKPEPAAVKEEPRPETPKPEELSKEIPEPKPFQPKPAHHVQKHEAPKPIPQTHHEVTPTQAQKPPETSRQVAPKQEMTVSHEVPKPETPKPVSVPEIRPAKQPKITTMTKIKGFFLGKVKISEKDADPFIEDLKIGLIQSDVNYDVSERLAQSIRQGLVGKEVTSKGVEVEIRDSIRGSILGVLTKSPGPDMINMAREKQARGELPFKIMFIGPNGAGKTTTMAKVASMFLSNNISCVLSASDTFRAAAIEQTAYHAAKLGVNVIKGTYGADPASVAFDAIAHAKAHGIMAVLIDSAGRQETNKSLIEELKKMVRIAKPDLKVFVGESISGNALLDQVKALNEAVGLDGIILTKLDCDAKGGNTISILSDTTVPILFFGTGEKYTDIMSYDPQFIVDNILPNN